MIFLIGALFTVLVGTAELYLCRRFGASKRFSVLLPANRSIWEQLKVIFWPMVIFSVAEYFNYGTYFENFIAAKAVSVLFAMIWSIALSYVFDSVWGKRSFASDVCITSLSSAAGWTANYALVKNYCLSSQFEKVSGTAVILALMLCFALFTFTVPQKSIFREREM